MIKKIAILVYCSFILFWCREVKGAELIVYSRPVEEIWQLWLYDAHTGEHTQLTRDLKDKRQPSFSPDGKKVLYKTGNGRLFILDIATKEEQEVCSHVPYCSDPGWLNLKEIVFTADPQGLRRDSDIWIYNLETQKQKVISSKGLQEQPAVSPDAQYIAYISLMNVRSYGSEEGTLDLKFSGRHFGPQLFLKDMRGGKEKELTRFKRAVSAPCFSPKGDTIVFVLEKARHTALYLCKLKTGKITALTDGRFFVTSPSWLNDTEIIYSSYEESRFKLNRINIHTKKITPLIETDTDCSDPDCLIQQSPRPEIEHIKRLAVLK